MAVTYFTLSALGIFKKKSKLIVFMMLAMLWVVYGLNTHSGDFDNYEWIYIHIENPGYWTEYEPLFTLFMYICHKLGLTFIQFRMAFGAVYLFLLHKVICIYTKNEAEVLGLYMVFPFLYFASVIRSGMAAVLVTLAFYSITYERQKKFKFWLLMAAAVLVHYTSIVFGFYYFISNKKIIRKSTSIICFTAFCIWGLYVTNFFYRFLSLFISNKRFLKWFRFRTDNIFMRTPKWIVYQFVIVISVIMLMYLLKKMADKYDVKEDAKLLLNNAFYFNCMLLIFSPVFFISNTAMRMVWGLLLLDIICCVKLYEESKSKLAYGIIKVRIPLFVIWCFLVLFSIYSNLPYRGTDIGDFSIFEYNVLMKHFK